MSTVLRSIAGTFLVLSLLVSNGVIPTRTLKHVKGGGDWRNPPVTIQCEGDPDWCPCPTC